ncbi:MAG TPA: hypothetical protein VM939_13230, partial [Gemmatimonadaceae bacterium]|nr:hypothetical protein [Gemmatimonadaceae bacterium]
MKTRLQSILTIASLSAFAVSADAQVTKKRVLRQSPPKPASVSADSVASSKAAVRDSLGLPRRPTPTRQQFWFQNGVTNVYDSNIEHDSTNIGSYGVIVGATGRYRSASEGPAIHLEYGVAVHEYTATDKWDRVSHLARAGVDMPLGSVLLIGLTGEGYLKGSSEDREVGDQYALIPRIEIRPVD